MSEFTPGTMLQNKYRLERLLGAGSIGEVWLATDIADNSQVAIKILHWRISNPQTIDRFVREKQAMKRLSKEPNIVAAYTLLRWEEPAPNNRTLSRIAIVMDYIEKSKTLRTLAFYEKPSAYEALRIVSEILTGLMAAHVIGIVHRDLKPENVLVDLSGHEPRAMLIDFGIALVSTSTEAGRMTVDGTTLGTPQYVAPEQWHSARLASPRSDLFSVGVMLAELFGVPPIAGDVPMIRIEDEDERLEWLAAIDNPVVREIVERATRNEIEKGQVVERRYASAKAMRDAVLAVMKTLDAEAPRWTVKPEFAAKEDLAPAANAVASNPTAVPSDPSDTAGHESALKYGTRVEAPDPFAEPEVETPTRMPRWKKLGLWLIGLVVGICALIGVVVMNKAPSTHESKEVPVIVETPPIMKPENPPAIVKEVPAPIVTPTKPKVLPQPAVEPSKEARAATKVPHKDPVVTNPTVTPESKVEITDLKVTLNASVASVKRGDMIPIAATIVIPPGKTMSSVTVRWRGDSGGAWQALTKVTMEGALVRASLPTTESMGNAVTYKVDVRLADDPGTPHTSTAATTSITP